MPLDPVTATLLTSLGTALAIEGIKGGVKGTVEGYKAANQESAELFLELVYFFGIIAPPSTLVLEGRAKMDPIDYLSDFRRFKKPNFNKKADRDKFHELITTRDPKFMAFVVTMAGVAALALYPVVVVKGTVKGIAKKIVKFFD